MKKLSAALVAVLVFATAAVALAVTNTYQVTASTSPTKAGSKKHPVPVKLKFNYSVDEETGQRPSPVKQYKIKFAGIRVNTKAVRKTCSAEQINGAGNDSVCSKGAIVGSGSVDNRLGPTNDPNNQDLHCYLDLTLYNAKNNHATLYLKGRSANAAPQDCITNIDVGIDATYVRSGSSTTLQFTVPPALLHPVPGLDNAVRNVQSSIKRIIRGKGRKRTAYYSSVGKCRKHQRAITVTFVPESGTTRTAQTFAKCR